MLFNSIEFLIFLPVVFVLYWFVCGRSLRLQNVLVVAASYVFYGWWDWRFLILIAFTSLCSWLIGVLIQRYRCDSGQGNCGFDQGSDSQYFVGAGGESSASTADVVYYRRAKLVLWLNIGLNLAILGIFKYYDFFAASFANVFLDGRTDGLLLNLVLPIGISFYTFKAMSYTIDVYKGKIEAETDVVNIFAYISFFPQLLCGPIARANDFLPQFRTERRFSYGQASSGMKQIAWGLFKKSMIADNCAYYVDTVYGDIASQTSSTLVLCAILYSIQIYCDFSGYSDMSIGIGRLFGIETKENFRYPYFSRSVREFWRRWHISLTSWFTDYVYIPLGGSRVPKGRVILNTLVVFVLSGLWHGANWTFVLWGLFNALFFIPSILTGRKSRVDAPLRFKDLWKMGLTFAIVTFGWILFRAEYKSQAYLFIARILSGEGLCSVPWINTRAFYIPLSVSIALMFVVEWGLNKGRNHVFVRGGADRIFSWFFFIAITLLTFFCGSPSSSYIYFQF